MSTWTNTTHEKIATLHQALYEYTAAREQARLLAKILNDPMELDDRSWDDRYEAALNSWRATAQRLKVAANETVDAALREVDEHSAGYSLG